MAWPAVISAPLFWPASTTSSPAPQPATMRFRRRRPGGFDRSSVLLAPRSIYHLAGEVRHEWEHSIAAMEVTRWSITLRSLSAGGPQLTKDT